MARRRRDRVVRVVARASRARAGTAPRGRPTALDVYRGLSARLEADMADRVDLLDHIEGCRAECVALRDRVATLETLVMRLCAPPTWRDRLRGWWDRASASCRHDWWPTGTG